MKYLAILTMIFLFLPTSNLNAQYHDPVDCEIFSLADDEHHIYTMLIESGMSINDAIYAVAHNSPVNLEQISITLSEYGVYDERDSVEYLNSCPGYITGIFYTEDLLRQMIEEGIRMNGHFGC